MKKILLASHGKLASGLKNSIAILTGMEKSIETIDAYVDETDYTEKIEAFIETLSSTDEVFIFTDIYGGSVNQKVLSLTAEMVTFNIRQITGMNLPIILSVLLESSPLSDETLERLITESQVKRVNPQAIKETDQDFFD